MNWILPGTVLEMDRGEADQAEAKISALFLAGGMVLSQVTDLTGLEPYTVQNWVKRGFLPPPVRKRYSRRQLCRIININMLKNILPMETICGLLGYVNGALNDESDDLIDDAELYFLFVRLAARTDTGAVTENALTAALSHYVEPAPGARDPGRKYIKNHAHRLSGGPTPHQSGKNAGRFEKGELTWTKTEPIAGPLSPRRSPKSK